tara:strand:+ start:2691 stop:3980 length:1290 start_codon:yes stop_codon:yes gene_type:complete
MLIVGLGAGQSVGKPNQRKPNQREPNRRDDTPSRTGNEGNVHGSADVGVDDEIDIIIGAADQVAEQLAEQIAADGEAAEQLAADDEGDPRARTDEQAAEEESLSDHPLRHIIDFVRIIPRRDRRGYLQGRYPPDDIEEILHHVSRRRRTQGRGAGPSVIAREQQEELYDTPTHTESEDEDEDSDTSSQATIGVDRDVSRAAAEEKEEESLDAQLRRHLIDIVRMLPSVDRRSYLQGRLPQHQIEEILHYASRPTQGRGIGRSRPIAPTPPTSNRAKEVFRTPEMRREILQYMLPTEEQLAERAEQYNPTRQARQYLLNRGFTQQEVDQIYEASTGRGIGSSKDAAIAPTTPPRDDVELDDIGFEEVDNTLSLQDMRRELEEMKRREGRFLNSASTNRKLRSDIQRLKGIIGDRERREREVDPPRLFRFL